MGKAQSNSDSGSTARQVHQRPTPAGEPEKVFEQESTPALEPQPRASWNFAEIRLFPPGRDDRPQVPFPFHGKPLPGVIQTKRVVNEPGDEFEQQAERVAGELMEQPKFDPEKRFGEISTPAHSGDLESSALSGDWPLSHPARSSGIRPPIQTRAIAPPEFGMPPIVYQVLNSPGMALDPEARAYFEPRLGRDFSSVRIHTDAVASLSAQSIGAHAYTSGNNIAFGAGRFSPATAEGKRLLAHELTHVIQQDAAAGSFFSGTSRQARPAPIQRQAAPGSASAAIKSPVVQKIVAYWHSKGVAWAFLSDESMKSVEVITNTLEPGSYTETPQGPPSGPKDAEYIQLVSSGFAWRQPVTYYEPGTSVTIEIQLTSEQRVARLPDYIRAYVARDDRKHPTEPELEKQADDGEAMVRNGITREDLAAADDPGAVINVKGEAPALDLSNDSEVVESMRRRGFSDFPSEKQFKSQLANQMRREENSSAWWDNKSATDYWKEFPEDAAKEWNQYAGGHYKSAVHDEAEAWRRAFRRMDAAASVANGIAWVTVAVAGSFVAAEGAAITAAADLPAAIESLTGVRMALWMKALTATFMTTNFAQSLIKRYKEAQETDTNIVSTVFAAIDDAMGASKIYEAIRKKSILSGQELNQTTGQRGANAVVGAFESYFTLLGASEFFGEPLAGPKPSGSPSEGTGPKPDPEPPQPSGPQGVHQGDAQGTGVPTAELRSVGTDNTLGPVYKRPQVQVQDQAPTGAGAANDNVPSRPLRAVAGDPTKPPETSGDTGKSSSDPAASGKSAGGKSARPSGTGPTMPPEDAARIKQLDEWIRKGVVKRGEVAKLREQLQSADEQALDEARAEFDANKDQIESGDAESHGWEKHEPAGGEKMSTGTKSELENSGWLKKRIPDPEGRKEFMDWLKAGHKQGDMGPEIPENQRVTESHEHYRPGAPDTEEKVREWERMVGRRGGQ